MLTLALLAASSRGEAQSQAAPLTSAAIDLSIYRDGEVRRFSSVHADWRVVCDEVTRLKQRFCSLRSLIVAADGGLAAELTVSTGQDGRPAALVTMREMLVRDGLNISVPALPAAAAPTTSTKSALAGKPKSGAATAPSAETRLKPVGCDKDICTLIWTLKPEQIGALDDGRGLKLVATAGPDLSSLAALQPAKQVKINLNVSGLGFKEAVAISLQPFE